MPTISGLPLEQAQRTIREAGFTFGEVLEERFDASTADTVLAALGEDGEPLAETYPERGRVDLVVSAGAIPEVAGLSVEQATRALQASGLTVDASLAAEEYHAEIEKGRVIAMIPTTDPVRPGDSVGLTISLGPELFEIPDVSGMGLQEAMDALAGAGFSPTTLVPDALRGFAKATGTDPAAGERVPAGTEIRVKSTISL